ncbi:MAG: hypothetical protein RR361_04980, partial [Anaerovorax sp.]
KGVVWLTTPLAMVENRQSTDFVGLMGLVDTANGIVPRKKPTDGLMTVRRFLRGKKRGKPGGTRRFSHGGLAIPLVVGLSP